jgi:hypothetical protein
MRDTKITKKTNFAPIILTFKAQKNLSQPYGLQGICIFSTFVVMNLNLNV